MANCGKISILSKIVNDPWNWLDEFLLFIKDHYFRYLISYSLIPNMNSIFVQLTDDLATSKSVPENMIQCIESLNIIWKNNHIHKMLPNFSTGNDHNTDYAISKIHEKFTKWSPDILKLMEYIPYDEKDESFIQKRKTVYELCSVIWKNSMSEMKNGNEFPKRLWDEMDDIVYEKIINSRKREMAECLLRIIPENSNDNSNDKQDQQRVLFF